MILYHQLEILLKFILSNKIKILAGMYEINKKNISNKFLKKKEKNHFFKNQNNYSVVNQFLAFVILVQAKVRYLKKNKKTL